MNALASSDSIVVRNAFLWHSYSINSAKVSRNEVSAILSSNQYTSLLIKESHANAALGYVCLTGAVGSTAFLVSEALKSKNETGRLPLDHSFAYAVGITSCVWVVGIVSLSGSNRKFHRAIKIYNSKINNSFSQSEFDFNLGVNYLSLTYKF